MDMGIGKREGIRMAVTCEACQRQTDGASIRECAECGDLMCLCWTCSDSKPRGTVEVKHTNCVEAK